MAEESSQPREKDQRLASLSSHVKHAVPVCQVILRDPQSQEVLPGSEMSLHTPSAKVFRDEGAVRRTAACHLPLRTSLVSHPYE